MPAYEARMQPQARTRQAKPLTEHHMFVPLIALWFGALFSLSSLAVRTGLFEQMIVAVGVDRLFPYASPPLGHTARLLIAAVFGLIGAGIGAMLARVVAGGALPGERQGDWFYPAPGGDAEDYRVRARDAHPDAPARRPISASVELASAELASAELAGHELGGDSPDQALAGRRVPAPWVPRVPVAAEPAEPETPPLPEWFNPAPTPVVPAPAVPLAAPIGEEPVVEVLPPARPVLAGAAGEVTDPDYPDVWRNTAERIAHAPPAALGHVELIERLAIALNTHDAPARPGADGRPSVGIAPPPPGADAAATIQALRDALSTLRGG